MSNQPDRPQPSLDQLRPSCDWVLRAAQSKSMLAVRVQMHFYRNPGVLQRDVVNQRVTDSIRGIVFGVQQKGGRRLACDRNIRIQLKLLGPNPEMPRIK